MQRRNKILEVIADRSKGQQEKKLLQQARGELGHENFH